jgi:hypothetical protein
MDASLAAATYASSGTASSVSCSFDDGPTTQTVRARIIDKDDGFSEYTSAVTVANVAPTATFSNNGPVNEGSSFTLSMTGGDDVSAADKAAKFTFAFDCGDGSGHGPYTTTPALSASTSCATGDNGTRSVKGKIRDKDGGFRSIEKDAPWDPTGTTNGRVLGPMQQRAPRPFLRADMPAGPASDDTVPGHFRAYLVEGSGQWVKQSLYSRRR